MTKNGIKISYNEKVKSVSISKNHANFDFQLLDLVICSKCKSEYTDYHKILNKEMICDKKECCLNSDKIYIITNYYLYNGGYGIRDELSRRIVLNKREDIFTRDLLLAIFKWYLENFAIELLKSELLIPVPGTRNNPNKPYYPQMDYIVTNISNGFGIPNILNPLSKEYEKEFEINERNPLIYNKEVLLFDDVYSDGNTYNSCSALLKNLGAKCVNSIILGKTFH